VAICVCRYPIILTDKRDGLENKFICIPVEIVDGDSIPIPQIEFVKEESFSFGESLRKFVKENDFDNKKKEWVVVKWNKPSNVTKRYNVADHIVIAGCPEDQLTCNSKSIYEVYHPIDEWYSLHDIEIGPKE